MNRFLKGIGVLLALLAVGVLSAVAVLFLLLRQENATVPDLVGQDIVTAIEIVSREGLQIKIDRREPSQSIPKDFVVSQSPPPNAGIKKGRAVKVVVSQGPSELLTPKLIGEPYRKAEITLRQAGFTVDIARAWSDSIERDMVIAQDPPAGTPLDKGSEAGILVSSGKKPVFFITPRLVGRKAEEAVRIVDDAGLQHRIVTTASRTTDPAAGRVVVSQKPMAGHPVAGDGVVELVVTK